MYATDVRRQTDVRQHHRLMPPGRDITTTIPHFSALMPPPRFPRAWIAIPLPFFVISGSATDNFFDVDDARTAAGHNGEDSADEGDS